MRETTSLHELLAEVAKFPLDAWHQEKYKVYGIFDAFCENM